jgi:hypothetical protein
MMSGNASSCGDFDVDEVVSGYFRDPDGHLWEIIWDPGRA